LLRRVGENEARSRAPNSRRARCLVHASSSLLCGRHVPDRLTCITRDKNSVTIDQITILNSGLIQQQQCKTRFTCTKLCNDLVIETNVLMFHNSGRILIGLNRENKCQFSVTADHSLPAQLRRVKLRYRTNNLAINNHLIRCLS